MKFLFYALAILISSLFLFFWFDDKGGCMERGGVWDEDENRCRFDCLLWTQKTGCVQLDDSTLSALEQCGQDIKCHHSVMEKVMLELCRKYKGKYNPKDNNCNFEAAD